MAVTHFSFGIAPTIIGFAALSNFGNVYAMENKNPLTLGETFEKLVRIDDRNDFITLTALPATEGSQQFFLATTRSGRHYYSKDLKSWTHQSGIPLSD